MMKQDASPDQEAIARVLSGDYNAFETLVEKYAGRIYRHLRKMVKDNQHAEDLLQETFLSAYRGLPRYEGDSSFSTWLFRIATNNALMFLRKNHVDTVEYDDHVAGNAAVGSGQVSPEFLTTPLEILLSQEGRRKIEQAIDHLPVIYRSVIVLRDVEGFSLKEVADILDSSVAAIKSRLHRARNSVREELSEYYREEADLS
jgi:RNA polymerase sigma-70 factor, ECF subfamily